VISRRIRRIKIYLINYKITDCMKKTNNHYAPPQVEVVEVEVEKGFATSYEDENW
jgi:hypothetical protein